MKKFGNFICKNKLVIIIITLILLIPAVIGMNNTKINYDILVYLPKDIETIKGQNILTDDFNMGAFSISMIDNMNAKDVLKLEQKIKKVKGVNEVVSLYDAVGTTIPIEMLPKEVTDRLAKGNSSLLLITFKDGTSDETTLNAISSIKSIVKHSCKISGMSAMALDTMELSNKEITAYVIIAVVLCLTVLMICLDSYTVPFILLLNIGVAILFNMGTNVFLGNISYITKAISAVLQLGVTMDFSIFLYHKYEKCKKEDKDKNNAMTNAIKDTITAVTGSSLTTIAGFLALCAMTLTLGKDIGIVMAKGVFFGVACVITLFPALLLTFDKLIDKTTHKVILPSFKHLKAFTIKHYKAIFIVFLILLVPAWYGQMKTKVYYNLDRTLPSTLDSSIANSELKNKYNIVSPEVILVDKNLSNDDINNMMEKIRKVNGIDFVISTTSVEELGIPSYMFDSKLSNTFESDKYKMIVMNSTYGIATDKLNSQIDTINKIVKKYDKKAIVAGEGPLMKDLVEIAGTDFNNVTYVSIIVIMIIMLFVLKSVSLPLLLTGVIEFAIFVNMSVPYYAGTTIPFIASIVIGTIQLGATIDYAILMTTKYLEERKTKDKFEAIKVALDNSVSSIFVSGMCFFAATFGVGVYSKLEMIGSLCTLISRGALISMVTVIMVLPSVLIIFDKLICKTTKGFKKGDNKMKNNKKVIKAMSIIMVSTMLVLPSNVFALTKDETVYAKLKNNGDVKKVSVTEHLINNGSESNLTDLTTLTNIYNVNGNEKFTLNSNTISWASKEGKDIYYQGTSNNTLPVSMKITYKLNGKEMTAKKMLGKKGNVEINIKYTNNDKHYMNNETVYTPFVIGLTSTISSKYNSNINVTNGKVITTGTNNVIAAIAAPGLYESLNIDQLKDLDTITISYKTTNFSLSSMYCVITPKILEDTDIANLNNLDDIYSKVDTLTNSAVDLVNGSKKLAEATNKAYNGSVTLKNAVDSSVITLKNDTTDALDQATVDAIKNKALASVSSTFTAAYENAIGTQAENETQANIDATIKQLEANGIDQLATICSSASIPQNYIQTCIDKKSYIIKYQTLKNPDIVSLMKDTAKQTAIKTAEDTAKQTAVQTAESVSKGVANQVKQAATNKTIASLNTLSSNISTLVNGLKEINDGANQLSNGLNKFNDEGISKISEIVNGQLKSKITTIKNLKTLSDNYSSFTIKNSNVKSTTKFIILIDGIKK